jgi:hypothetical protein
MATKTFFDIDGIERNRPTNRKVRKDKGTCKPHPIGCLHCEMVREFWAYRQNEVQEQANTCGDEWHNDGSIVYRYTLMTWQAMYYGELRRHRDYELEQESSCAEDAGMESPTLTGS